MYVKETEKNAFMFINHVCNVPYMIPSIEPAFKYVKTEMSIRFINRLRILKLIYFQLHILY